MATIGYMRVSDDRQNEGLQMDALIAAGCEKLYSDHGVSGASVQREGLDEVLATLKPGDTFVVWKFDRLGRSTVHLLLLFDDFRKRGIHFISTTQGINTATFEGRIFFGQLALFAEYERELIRQRTKAGMLAARRRGAKIGRPRKLEIHHVEIARQMRDHHIAHAKIAADFGISPRTLSRALNGPTSHMKATA
ncbi:MAG: recombinase family protein [Pseudomonadota bacterium]